MSVSDRERWLSSPPSAFNRYCHTVAQAGTRSPLLQWPTVTESGGHPGTLPPDETAEASRERQLSSTRRAGSSIDGRWTSLSASASSLASATEEVARATNRPRAA